MVLTLSRLFSRVFSRVFFSLFLSPFLSPALACSRLLWLVLVSSLRSLRSSLRFSLFVLLFVLFFVPLFVPHFVPLHFFFLSSSSPLHVSLKHSMARARTSAFRCFRFVVIFVSTLRAPRAHLSSSVASDVTLVSDLALLVRALRDAVQTDAATLREHPGTDSEGHLRGGRGENLLSDCGRVVRARPVHLHDQHGLEQVSSYEGATFSVVSAGLLAPTSSCLFTCREDAYSDPRPLLSLNSDVERRGARRFNPSFFDVSSRIQRARFCLLRSLRSMRAPTSESVKDLDKFFAMSCVSPVAGLDSWTSS